MLDQNTDRMWFVIGAVIVGAAIIFIANGTMPEIFASVSNSIEDASNEAMGVIDEMEVNNTVNGKRYSANLIDVSTVTFERWVSPTTGELVEPSGFDHTASDYIPVIAGEHYEISGKNGLHNPAIAFYGGSYNYLSGKKPSGNNMYDVSFEAPDSAKYARISSRDANYSHSPRTSSKLEDWTFRQVLFVEGSE